MNLGVNGAGLAIATTYILEFSAVTIISHCIPRIRKALFCPTEDSYNNWDEYLKISMPVTLMMVA